ncbi:MAG: hypothetical protein AAF787_05930, partial [Chloroflexota bacterium]
MADNNRPNVGIDGNVKGENVNVGGVQNLITNVLNLSIPRYFLWIAIGVAVAGAVYYFYGDIRKVLELRMGYTFSGDPFLYGKFGVLLAEFDSTGVGSSDETAEIIEDSIERGFNDANMHRQLIRLPYKINNRREAVIAADLYNASLVIYGDHISDVDIGSTQAIRIDYEYTPQSGTVLTRRNGD